jgi:signal transduction histidine kinase
MSPRTASEHKKKRKAFKTSPSVRIPRAAVEKLQESKAQAQAQAEEIRRLTVSVSAAAHDNAVYVDALRDLIGFFDKVAGSSGSWCVAEVKRIEEIRLLSLGI